MSTHDPLLLSCAMASIPASHPANPGTSLPLTPLDMVITVCDQAAGETCPIFPGQPIKLHWSTPDPAKTLGNEVVTQAAFDRAFNFLKERVEQLIADFEHSE